MTTSRRLSALAALLLLAGLSACAGLIDENATLDDRVMEAPGVESSADRATQPGSAGANPAY